MLNIIENFRIKTEKEDFQTVIENISKDVVFKGTNLWVLVFAIFIASLGLNVNSTAVIIGAMLVSPLMGPIMGLGLGMAINDLALLRKAIFNYLFAAGVGLATSTIYFLISPINEAHSEILARTSPNIYDVLIALFGGLAGIIATSSKQKGNVIPGVAIATALMPPLCTAGYGLATLQVSFLFGALYLFLINTVFIALATLITTRFLKFPFKHLPEKKNEIKAKRIVWGVVLITLLPSIYFGYDIVKQNKFQEKANLFVENEAVIPNNYLLKKDINTKNRKITLIYGGQFIEEKEIDILKSKLSKYYLTKTTLEIKQGFAYLKENKDNKQTNQLTLTLTEKEKEVHFLRSKLDSLDSPKKLGLQIFRELKAQYPSIMSSILQPAIKNTDTLQMFIWVSIIKFKDKLNKIDKGKIEQWLKIRLNTNEILLRFEE
jgi:uncharacterized hydrophobic protein (TIGR00271 family)